MKKLAFITFLVLSACLSTSYRNPEAPFPVVSNFDAQKYLGKWYQLARYPAWFEAGCVGDTAEYSLISDSEIQVVNSCFQKTLDGPKTVSKGVARIEKPGVLTVKFFGGFPDHPNYYVMALKGDYEMVVVGEPDGKSGWVMARTPQVSDADYQWGVGVLQKAGYDISKLYKTPQPEN